jgi:hypothetical protein
MTVPGGRFPAMSNCISARRASPLSVFPEKIESHSPELLSGSSSATVLSMVGVMFAVAANVEELSCFRRALF